MLFGNGVLGLSLDEETLQPKPIDGVFVDVLETYPSPKKHEIGVGLGLYPLNAYYNALALDTAYTYRFSKTYGWEIVNCAFAYTIDKGLTSELAEDYQVEPQRIERLKYIVSSNLIYTHSYGKFIFLEEHIKYFRSSAVGGLGWVGTSEEGGVSLTLGWRFDVFVNNSFSWRIEIRDNIATSHYLTFNLGTGISL